jgi:hypothetical protein
MNIIKLQNEIKVHFAKKNIHSVNNIAKTCGMTQSTVHRNLVDTPKTITDGLKMLCDYAGIDVRLYKPKPEENDTLMQALNLVWDGSEKHAKKLSELIMLTNSFRNKTF